MNLPDAATQRAFLGLFASQHANVAATVPTLFARLPPGDAAYGGRFAPERDLRFLRVTGPVRGVPVEQEGWSVSEAGLGALLHPGGPAGNPPPEVAP